MLIERISRSLAIGERSFEFQGELFSELVNYLVMEQERFMKILIAILVVEGVLIEMIRAQESELVRNSSTPSETLPEKTVEMSEYLLF